jgi:hypothetical protein
VLPDEERTDERLGQTGVVLQGHADSPPLGGDRAGIFTPVDSGLARKFSHRHSNPGCSATGRDAVPEGSVVQDEKAGGRRIEIVMGRSSARWQGK